MRGFASHVSQIAKFLVRAADEKPKPNGERMREFPGFWVAVSGTATNFD